MEWDVIECNLMQLRIQNQRCPFLVQSFLFSTNVSNRSLARHWTRTWTRLRKNAESFRTSLNSSAWRWTRHRVHSVSWIPVVRFRIVQRWFLSPQKPWRWRRNCPQLVDCCGNGPQCTRSIRTQVVNPWRDCRSLGWLDHHWVHHSRPAAAGRRRHPRWIAPQGAPK